MKIYKIANVRGEWWIKNGTAEFADGDIGEQSHESMVVHECASTAAAKMGLYSDIGLLSEDEDMILEHIIDSDEEFIQSYLSLSEEDFYNLSRYEIKEKLESDPAETMISYLKELGVKNAEDLVFIGYGASSSDVRLYAMKNFGWIRVAQNNIQTWTFTPEDYSSIREGLYDILDEDDDIEGDTVNLEVLSNNKFYMNIPLATIVNEGYKEVVHEMRGKALIY